MFWLGTFGFVLFFLNDINDSKLHSKWLSFLFPAGALCLSAACAFSLDPYGAPVSGLFWRVLLWLLFGAFMALTVWALFFSFPAAEGYASPGEKRQVCTTGLYSLCRHPGVLFLSCALITLCLCGGLPPVFASVYTVLNILLATYEDRRVFPLVLSGYNAYRRSTPFLIPGARHITGFFKTNFLTFR